MSTWLSKRKSNFLTKRRKFLIVSLLLTTGLWIIKALPVEQRYWAVLILAICSGALTAWSLFKDLRGRAWYMDLILPVLFPTTVAFFYFLLPQESGTHSLVLILFAIAMYGLLLTTNIFAVASIRTIQLLRAARAVGFLLSILTSALFYHVLFSLHLPLIVLVALIFIISFPILLQGIWSYTLSETSKGEVTYAGVGALAIAELSLGISFWLIDPPLASVLLAMAMYVILGILQHEVEERLFERTLQEYIGFAVIVLIVVMMTVGIRWVN